MRQSTATVNTVNSMILFYQHYKIINYFIDNTYATLTLNMERVKNGGRKERFTIVYDNGHVTVTSVISKDDDPTQYWQITGNVDATPRLINLIEQN